MNPVKKLSQIIQVSLQENSLDTLNEHLISLQNPGDCLNGKFISVLVELLKASGQHEEKTLHVNCVLNCLQHMVDTVADPHNWGKISEDVGKICELMLVITTAFIKEESVIQKVLYLISTIAGKMNCVIDDLFKFMSKTLLTSCLNPVHTKSTRFDMMILIGSLLQKSSRGMRSQILPSTIDHLNDLSNFLMECDNYETQVSVVEILARSLIFINEDRFKSLFTTNTKIGEMFKKYQPFLNFDPDCRLFLNEVNESLGDQQKVFSVPCMVVCADNSRLKKPNDPAYSDFWVDFNLGSRSVSFYYQLSNSDNWEIMTISQDKVISLVAKDSVCQSRSGEKFEAVKLELTIDSSGLSPNSELPNKVKIYPRKDRFSRIESVVHKIFNSKYQAEVGQSETSTRQVLGNQSSEANTTCNEKSYFETSTHSKNPEDDREQEREADKVSYSKSKAESCEESEEEESDAGSPYSRFIEKKRLEEAKNYVINSSREDEISKTRKNTNKESTIPQEENTLEKKGIDIKPAVSLNGGARVNISNQNIKSNSGFKSTLNKNNLEKYLEEDDEAEQRNVPGRDSVLKSDNCNNRKNSTELNNGSKKKRLYSFEKSNAEDVVMSSQDQVLSVEIPTYKLTKKETCTKPNPNINRKNISYSYITNKQKEKSAINTKQKRQEILPNEEDPHTQKSLSNDESSDGDSCDSSPKLFKDTSTKPKAIGKKESKKKLFFKSSKKDVELCKNNESPLHKYGIQTKSVYSDFTSPEVKERFKCKQTYGRVKPKKLLKRNRVMLIESSDSQSDSDSQYVPPPKLLKEGKEDIHKLSPRKTRFADSVVKSKVDTIRDRNFSQDVELEAVNEFEEPEMQPREIVSESLMKGGRVTKKVSAKVAQSKSTNAGKKKTAKQNTNQVTGKSKKPEPKIIKKNVIEKLSENLTDCMEVVHYEPPEWDESPLECEEDLALDLLSCNNDQEKALLHHTTFKFNDLVRFGKLLSKQIQDKMLTAERLAQKEREMNFATFDYKIQASCSGLYGSSQKMESVTDKLEKLNSMLQATYKLHKEIAFQITSETAKIEVAKNDLMKNVNKIKKSESSSISSIFQGLGGYLRKLVVSFVQRNTKNAINH